MHLCIRGWEINYISSNFNHAEKRSFSDKEYSNTAEKLPYHISLIKNGKYYRNLSLKRILWNQQFSIRAYKFLRNTLGERDVLIIPSRPPELIFAAAQLKKTSGCRILLDIRDIWPDALSEPSRILRSGFQVYCSLFQTQSVPEFDAYIHVASSFLPWLQRYAPGAKSTFIPLGFDENRWGDIAPRHPTPENRCLKLVHCGTLSYQLDVMPILESVARLSGRVSLTLIGDNGSGSRFGDVMAFIREHHLEANVKVLGLLPPQELVNELPRHDIAIVPMVSGALPNKVFDAIAAGLPMLSLGEGDSSTLVEKNGLGWISSFDSKAVYDVLNQITATQIQERRGNVLKHRPLYMQSVLFDQYEQVIASLL
jgi:glycosyltransferase involved in cell wall biosynthesis